MEQYIADKRVLGVTVVDEKTPAQSEMVKVIFEDNTEEVMPKMRFELVVTGEISNASAVQAKIREKVGSTLYSILHEYGVKFGEIEGIVDSCVQFANSGLEKATDILFKNTQQFLPLIEINKILIQNAKNGDNESSSAGSGVDSENKK